MASTNDILARNLCVDSKLEDIQIEFLSVADRLVAKAKKIGDMRKKIENTSDAEIASVFEDKDLKEISNEFKEAYNHISELLMKMVRQDWKIGEIWDSCDKCGVDDCCEDCDE
jgi:predicted  nucleic acid-binding Zn-ribbon protein